MYYQEEEKRWDSNLNFNLNGQIRNYFLTTCWTEDTQLMKMEASPLILLLLLVVLKNEKFMYRSEEITRKRSIRHSIDSITIKWSSIEFISDYNNVIRRCFVTVSSLFLCLGTNGRSCSANNPPNQKASFAVILLSPFPFDCNQGDWGYSLQIPELEFITGMRSFINIYLYPCREITWEQIFYIAQQQCRYTWRSIAWSCIYLCCCTY